MSFFTQGLNLIRDLHNGALTYGQLGTSGTAFVVSQTGLQAAVTASSAALTIVQASQSNQTTFRIDSVTATSNTFREYVSKNSAGTAYDRSVFPGFEHTGDSEFTVVKTYFYNQV